MTNTFDPLEFGFKRVDFSAPDYSVYEKDFGDVTETSPDFLSLNVFLSQSEDYVTIWTGLFDPSFAVGRLKFKNSHPATRLIFTNSIMKFVFVEILQASSQLR